MADIWKIKRVCDMIRSQDNVVIAERDERLCQDVSVNIEKSIQEETTSSSYVDAKNCFVQDACTQSACKNVIKEIDDFGANDEGNESSNRIDKIDYIEEIISDDRLSFDSYDDDDAEEIDYKYDGIISNRDHESKENVNVVSSTCRCCSMEENKSSDTVEMRTISKNYTDLPYVTELLSKEKCDCTAASFDCKYRFSDVPIAMDDIEGTNEFEISRKLDRETIGKIFKRNRTLDVR